MPRLVWLALFCLAALGCFTVVRSIVRPGVAAAPVPTSLVSADTDTPLAKGDRLPSVVLRQVGFEGGRLSYDILRQVGLDALKRSAAPTVPEPAVPDTVSEPKSAAAPTVTPKAAPPVDEVVSWHWREGSKVVRRRQSQ